ncbi:MAG: DUF2141 domain-containing protein [Ignavibacteria bacterium]|jgi:uncharacterized protein (DUF2141 family)
MKSFKNYLKLVFVVILVSQTMIAGNKDELLKEIKNLTYEGYFQFEKSYFIKAIGLCERITAIEPDNAEALYYSAYSGYRLLNIGMINEKFDLFDSYFNKTMSEAEKLFDNEKFSSEAYVVAASALMMKLATDYADAPNISAKIHGYLDNAEKQDQNNPRIYLTRGIMFYNTPVQFGGSIEKALKQFGIALKLFESNNSGLKKVSWGHAETYAWKGQAQLRNNEIEKSKSAYEAALNLEPDFGWVKFKLLPLLEKKSGDSSRQTEKIKQVKYENDSLSGKLTIIFHGFDSNSGLLKIALHNTKTGYDKNSPFKTGAVEINDLKTSFAFENVPFGEYAVKCYHDENSNNELDTNILGIPSEAYGFSNNARGSFGPADYDDAKFNFDHSGKEITIKVD